MIKMMEMLYIEIEVTSRGDETAKDDKTIRVSVEELETGVTLRREGSGLRTIAPGESDVIEFNVLSDGNGNKQSKLLPKVRLEIGLF